MILHRFYQSYENQPKTSPDLLKIVTTRVVAISAGEFRYEFVSFRYLKKHWTISNIFRMAVFAVVHPGELILRMDVNILLLLW